MSLLSTIIDYLSQGAYTINVCALCLRVSDRTVSRAGDFSLCDRCGASITSKTGSAVQTKAVKR